MSDNQKEVYRLEKFPNLSPKIANWYAIMEKSRERLVYILSNLEEEALDFTPDEEIFETIGTHVMHIAAVEYLWIFADMDGLDVDDERFKHGFALRPETKIPQIKGKSVQFYLDELKEIREQIYARFLKLKDEELEKIVSAEGEKFTVEWILFHIAEHEMMHIGQILFLRRLYSSKKENM